MTRPMVWRRAATVGDDVGAVVDGLAAQLAPAADLGVVVAFAHAALAPAEFAGRLARAVAPARVVGCTADALLGLPGGRGTPGAVALGLGGAARGGVGIARDLGGDALASARYAVRAAAAALGHAPEDLAPARHAVVTLLASDVGGEEAFCVGSASMVPRLRVVGGAAGGPRVAGGRKRLFADGEAIGDAGLVLIVESPGGLAAVASTHVLPTELRAVVTAGRGRLVDELDGQPAAARYAALAAAVGGPAGARGRIPFARYVGGRPFVRSVQDVVGDALLMAGAVEVGQVLRCMRPGALVGSTRAELARAVGALAPAGCAAVLAFSCVGRHDEAAADGQEAELAAAFGAFPVVGLESYAEQDGLVLVNHTLTGLALGGARG